MKHIIWIDYAKSIAIFLVVLLHTLKFSRANYPVRGVSDAIMFHIGFRATSAVRRDMATSHCDSCGFDSLPSATATSCGAARSRNGDSQGRRQYIRMHGFAEHGEENNKLYRLTAKAS